MYKTGHFQYGEALAKDRDWSKEDHVMAQRQHFKDWSAGVHLTLRFDIANFFLSFF